jgi:hypothetical protein
MTNQLQAGNTLAQGRSNIASLLIRTVVCAAAFCVHSQVQADNKSTLKQGTADALAAKAQEIRKYIEKVIVDKTYESWSSKPRHLTGRIINKVPYTAHGYLKVYYSKEVARWLRTRNAASKQRDKLENGATIVGLEYEEVPKPSNVDPEAKKKAEPKNAKPELRLKRILIMVRWTGDENSPGPHDGWFWSTHTVSSPEWDVSLELNFKVGDDDEVDLKDAKSIVDDVAKKIGNGIHAEAKKFDDSKILAKRSSGQFGDSRCISCHVSADNESLVFFKLKSGPDISKWIPNRGINLPGEIPHVKRELIQLREDDDPAVSQFLKYFGLKKDEDRTFDTFPAKKNDHVVARRFGKLGQENNKKAKYQFLTSDQCRTCHNASQLYSNTKPNMWYPEPYPNTSLLDDNIDKETNRNFSPYGEWSASLNGLSGRDPVWHAQVEFERRLRPELAEFTTSTCFSCHGPMAGRQLTLDGKEDLFNIEMFYATDEQSPGKPRDPNSKTNIGPDSGGAFAKYGALARDGVSCAVCHQISAKQLGIDPPFDVKFPTRHLDPDQLNSYTARFKVETDATKNAFWGPYEEGKLTDSKVASAAMDKALGMRGRHGPLFDDDSTFLRKFPELKNNPQIHESKLCGSCHTVIVPALRVGYTKEDAKHHRDKNDQPTKDPFFDQTAKMSFEQTTYFEWRNSRYENEIDPSNKSAMTCQACHMASHRKLDEFPDHDAQRIVNVLSDRYPPASGRAPNRAITYTKKDPIYRHVLLGINYFVFEMYEQFPGQLGAVDADPNVPKETLDPLINARDWIENHAERITADVGITKLEEINGNLETEVEITNLAGHKFPTGAGFRRAFIKFEVLGKKGELLWASGRTSPLGVLLDGNGKTLNSEQTLVPWKSQDHHQVITKEDEVQIYETRALNSQRKLQTTVLGIYHEYKDNRILPNGWLTFDHSKKGGPPKQNRNLEYSMEPLLVGKTSGREKSKCDDDSKPRHAPEHHPVLENIKRDKELDFMIRPPEIGDIREGAWATETEYSYEKSYDADYLGDYTFKSHPTEDCGAQRGQDHVIYRIPLDKIKGWDTVKARLYYQTIPPYFLSDRFTKRQDEEGGDLVHGPDLKRLAYMASHLNLDSTPAKNWSLPIGKPATAGKSDLKGPERMNNEDLENYIRKRLQDHYIYLDLQKPAPSKPNERK